MKAWIQYWQTTGLNAGTNTAKANDSDLAVLNKLQIYYEGELDPAILNVDITQTPHIVIVP